MSRLLGRLNLRLQMPHPWRRSSPGGHSSGERMYLGKPSSALCDEFPRTGGGDTAYGNAAERGEVGRRAGRWESKACPASSGLSVPPRAAGDGAGVVLPACTGRPSQSSPRIDVEAERERWMTVWLGTLGRVLLHPASERGGT